MPTVADRLRNALYAAFRLAIWLALGAVFATASEAGAEGPVDGVFTASSGLSGAYRMVLPDDLSPANPAGLVLFFHADGATGQQRSDADALAATAQANGLIAAALSVPWTGGAGGATPPDSADQCWWAPRAETNADYVREWIEDFLVATRGEVVDRDGVIFSGVSGGADFAIAAPLLLGFDYRGGAVGVCGGDLPRADGGSCISEPDPPPVLDPLPDAGDVPKRAKGQMLYVIEITADDPFRPLAIDARRYYRDLGFLVDFATPAGAGHCEFDEPQQDILRRRIVEVASLRADGTCTRIAIEDLADDLIDSVPLDVAQQAIPATHADRDALLAQIQNRLDGVEADRAEIPDFVYVCQGASSCPKIGMRQIKNDIEDRLRRLKKGPVKTALKTAIDPDERAALKDLNRSSHRGKLRALDLIPSGARLCAE